MFISSRFPLAATAAAAAAGGKFEVASATSGPSLLQWVGINFTFTCPAINLPFYMRHISQCVCVCAFWPGL